MEIQGKLFLAPMAGTADYAFRSICRSLGADIVCSEMVSAKATLYGDRKSAELAFLRDDERPAGIQLFGSEPDVMAKAAERVAVYRPLYIDINMGCPVHKVFDNAEGSALMRDVPKAAALIRAVVEATDIPVGVKMRLGVDSATRSAPALAEAAERAGAAFLTVHGRTRAQMYAGKADLDGIAEVVRAVGIPVVGNGDVTDAASAARMYAHTDCAAVMVGRGALGNPWVFRELACARAVDFPMERVFVHGNNKTPRELEEAISAGVGRIVLDSRIELARVNEIAGRLGVVQDVYMRITPGVEADTHEYIRTGCEDSKFGFTMREDFAFKCVGDVLAAENVRLVGLHCHIGSQIFALHSFREAAAVMVEFMARIRDTYGHEITELDLGGGLGIAYLAEHQPSSIDDFAEVTCSAVRDLCALHNLPLPRLLVEPGRSLVAPAGVTLYTVGILKTLPGIRKYVAIDGGMSDNIRTALYHADYEPTIANKAGQPREEIVTLCGKHCESGDAVVIDMPLQKADLGDIVCVFGTGAYNMTMASNYNGQPRPAVVFVRDGASRVVTRRETYEDLYQRDL